MESWVSVGDGLPPGIFYVVARVERSGDRGVRRTRWFAVLICMEEKEDGVGEPVWVFPQNGVRIPVSWHVTHWQKIEFPE